MPVTSVSAQNHLVSTQDYKKSGQADTFANLLSKQKENYTTRKNDIIQNSPCNLLEVGVINDSTPTVSHILKNNADFQSDSWNIIFSETNRGKQFRQMLPGTKVLIDKDTKEILWGDAAHERNKNQLVAEGSNLPVTELSQPKIPINQEQKEIINLGIISKEMPTVSHLLKNNANLPENYWNIINDPVNKDKPFTTLRPGTKTSLNTATNELIFNNTPIKTYTKVQTFQDTKPQVLQTNNVQANIVQSEGMSFSEKLVDSIKPLIGKPYKEIDCFGLVVRGLTNQGINYQGKDGLRQSLENAAKFKGLPGNAFLTGEGLIENNGTTIYSKTYLTISNFRKQADEIFSEIKNNLKKGHILSFSTPSRGHTGVVANRDNLWTYINSGLMDNTINETSGGSRKVGEEVLEEEIKNWCQRAQHRNEPLSITMGRLDEEKLKQFSKNNEVVNLSKL